MADEKDPRIITPIPKPLLARVDDYRFENRLPSRSEAMRRLIEAGLAKKPAASHRQKKPPQTKGAQIRALRELVEEMRKRGLTWVEIADTLRTVAAHIIENEEEDDAIGEPN